MSTLIDPLKKISHIMLKLIENIEEKSTPTFNLLALSREFELGHFMALSKNLANKNVFVTSGLGILKYVYHNNKP